MSLLLAGFSILLEFYNFCFCVAGTQKLIKRNFQVEGFNIEKIQDEVYILDTKNKSYKILDKEMYSNIKNGNVRF